MRTKTNKFPTRSKLSNTNHFRISFVMADPSTHAGFRSSYHPPARRLEMHPGVVSMRDQSGRCSDYLCHGNVKRLSILHAAALPALHFGWLPEERELLA